MTTSCAGPRLISTAADAPQIEMTAQARAACSLHRLPAAPTQADLEIGYATRGVQLVACDGARAAAVAIHDAEHALEARHAEARTKRLRPWWRFW